MSRFEQRYKNLKNACINNHYQDKGLKLFTDKNIVQELYECINDDQALEGDTPIDRLDCIREYEARMRYQEEQKKKAE